MWEKIKSFILTHTVAIYTGLTALILFLLIFVIPQFVADSTGLINLILVFIFITVLQFLAYKVIMFRKNNKDFPKDFFT